MRITGYPIVFDANSIDLGFVEVIRSSAVDRILRERADVVALKNHDSNFPLGRVSAGTLSLRKDPRGLLIDIDADEQVGYVSDLVTVIKRGDATGGSFAFTALDDVWSLMSDGKPFREVLDMNVREISVGVTFPAYRSTMLSVRAQGDAPRGRSIAQAEREHRLRLLA